MKNKLKNKILFEQNNKEMALNEDYFTLNSTINEFKDIDIKKIFIKKQLKLNDSKNLINEIKVSTNNNELNLCKYGQIKKKLYPQLNESLSPKMNNTLSKSKTNTGNYPIDNFSCLLNTSNDKFIPKINVKKESKYKLLLNSIQVNKRSPESINNSKIENNKEKEKEKEKDNNNYSLSQRNRTLRNNELLNYIKKKAIYQGKKENIINNNNTINKNNPKKNEKSYISVETLAKSSEKNNRNIDVLNHYLNNLKTEKKFIKNFKLKKTFLLNPNKTEDNFKTIKKEKSKSRQKQSIKINKNDSHQKMNTLLMKEKHDNNNNNNNNNILNQTMNDKLNDKDNKEKRRYIYINRKIRYNKNDTKINDKNKNKNKKDSFKVTNKANNKIMEIKVENGNSMKSHSLTKDDIKLSKLSKKYLLSEKKEDINDTKFTLNQKLNSELSDKNIKKKSFNNIRPFQTLNTIINKSKNLGDLKDSYNKLHSSGPTSARNLEKSDNNVVHLENYNKLSESYYKGSSLSYYEDTSNTYNNSMVNNNKYFKKQILKNLNNEEKNHYNKYNNFYNTEKLNVRYTNKIVNNNTFNTTVNFYKIQQIPIDINKNSIGSKNIVSKRKSNNNYEIKRNNSVHSTYIKKYDRKTDNAEKTINNKNHNSFNNNKFTKVDKNEDNQHNEYDIDLEILYILEAKIKSVLNKINNYAICYNECYDWINYYFNCKFYEKEINLFKLSHNKNNIIYYIKIELLCYFLCYDVSFNKNFNQAGILFKTIFNLLHINFLILISFVINKNNNDNNCNNIKENDDNFCLNRLKEIINKDLKLKLNAQDMNENSILLLISNNFKEINNYYKMIIDNLYSYYYLINDDSNINKSINKFPNCLSLNINSLNNIQKSNIISLFFFDSYKLSNNYNIEDLNNFFEIFLYKSKENESLIIYNNSMSLNDNNNEYDNERYNNTISNYYTYCPNNQIKYNENNYILGKTINNNKNNIFMDDYYLPPIQSYYKYTLVLDLDETLVYYQKDPNYLNNIYNINNIKNTLILRPGLLDFLHKMKPLYELVLFSFGTKEYVDTILSVIEKKEKIFEYVLYRQHATYEKGDYVKNLELLGRDLKKVIIVDDIPRAFKLQKNNGICIKAFYGDTISDRNTLKLLGMILEKIRFDAEENDGDIRNSLQKQRNLIFTHITTNLDC